LVINLPSDTAIKPSYHFIPEGLLKNYCVVDDDRNLLELLKISLERQLSGHHSVQGEKTIKAS
jgi:hypothetical protein